MSSRGSTDTHLLCCNCGEITQDRRWTYLQRDMDTDELRPSREGEYDPICRCPVCGWNHTDDDSGPGLYSGSHGEMLAEKQGLLADRGYDWAEDWAAEAAERVANHG